MWHRWSQRIIILSATIFTLSSISRANQQTGIILPAILEPLMSSGNSSYDAQQREIMPMTTDLPWGAIGFLDNGCTATLIDKNHILAASHCFTFDYDGVESSGTFFSQGAWQQNLVFFPNYHPNRSNPPRVKIDRVIVGSRVQSDFNTASDWGIAHLETPITDFPSLTITPMEQWQFPAIVSFAGYARDATLFPDKEFSYPQPPPSNYCANFKNNCWWTPALVDPRCLAINEHHGLVQLDNFSCLIQGGNSGSPVIWKATNSTAQDWPITGLISGGGMFWSATRFQHAPRYATDIAIATYKKDKYRTAVFAIDSDLSKVVSRYSEEASISGQFTYFEDMGKVRNPLSISAVTPKNGKPLVVVTGKSEKLAINHLGTNEIWEGWKTIQGPEKTNGIRDISVINDMDGTPRVYLVGNDFKLYTRSLSYPSSAINIAPWIVIEIGSNAKRISAILHKNGRQQIFIITNTGTLKSIWQTTTISGSTWSKPARFSTSTLPPLMDVSAGWTPDGYVQVFTIDKNGDGWARACMGNSPESNWNSWSPWSVPLYAPNAASPPKLKGIVSITANRWQENSLKTKPVVFATDEQGNIYVTTFEGDKWKPWLSFYN